MIDLRKIENWERVDDNEFKVNSLRQILDPYTFLDKDWCGRYWVFRILTMSHGNWFLEITLHDVESGKINPGYFDLFIQEFLDGTNMQNRKAAITKAYNIAKAVGLV